MVKKLRIQKIAERVKEELSNMLLYDITDPRLEGVTVTDVTIDRELAFATIFVSAFEGSERKDEILDGFNSARGFLRYHLSQRIDLRSFPQLRFKWDLTAERANRMEELFSSLSNEKSPGDTEKDTDD